MLRRCGEGVGGESVLIGGVDRVCVLRGCVDRVYEEDVLICELTGRVRT